ncbi:MAG: AAA family ATPase [Chloroflexi bacterium]|nr:AAA family ATPase [Chloroflexota bacterium]
MALEAITPYQSNLEHLLAELGLLDLMLSVEAQRVMRRNTAYGESDFQGLLVSEREVGAILFGDGGAGELPPADAQAYSQAISQREEELAMRARLTLEKGIPLRLETLKELLELNRFEARVVMLCLAPELDLKYETLYSYVQNDVGKKRPTVNLALTLFCGSLPERIACRALFAGASPLVGMGLVHVGDDSSAPHQGFLSSFLSADQRLVDYLLYDESGDTIEPQIAQFTRLADSPVSWESVVFPPGVEEQVSALVERLPTLASNGRGAVLQIVGPAGTGKKTIARAVCGALERRLLVVDCAGLLDSDLPPARVAALAFREALLQQAVLYLDSFHLLVEDGARQRSALAAVASHLRDERGLAVLGGVVPWRPENHLEGKSFLTLEVPYPDYAERVRLWEIHLNGHRDAIGDEEIAALSGKFRLRGGQIRQAVATARDLARLSSASDATLAPEDLHAASRWHSSQRLAALARKIEPSYGWDDIVLPPDQKTQLHEICSQFSNTALVYGDWGFQSKTSLGKGLNILFAGSSGTGKTMAADIMAGALGLDLYKIDLSAIVSKYIGETEKNLDRIFQEAQDSNAVLFFDEADALFGKRSEVKDSHDRYANIEISYLLQKMEEYQGIVILATNFRKNMDDAFVRRMHFVLEFPVPEEEDRLEIWRRVFPPQAPTSDDFDLRFVAKQFKLAGGNIKNIAVTSAFLAAQDGRPIGMEQIMLATKREYQKMGKLLVETEFGPYFPLVKNERAHQARRIPG